MKPYYRVDLAMWNSHSNLISRFTIMRSRAGIWSLELPLYSGWTRHSYIRATFSRHIYGTFSCNWNAEIEDYGLTVNRTFITLLGIC